MNMVDDQHLADAVQLGSRPDAQPHRRQREVTSNRSSRGAIGWVIVSIIVAASSTNPARHHDGDGAVDDIVADVPILDVQVAGTGVTLFQKVIASTASVVVLTPPAVPPGLPPMNM